MRMWAARQAESRTPRLESGLLTRCMKGAKSVVESGMRIWSTTVPPYCFKRRFEGLFRVRTGTIVDTAVTTVRIP